MGAEAITATEAADLSIWTLGIASTLTGQPAVHGWHVVAARRACVCKSSHFILFYLF
jgi:hypothetical protein